MDRWSRDLLSLQTFSLNNAIDFFAKKGWTKRQESKGKKFFVERYVHNVRIKALEVSASCFPSQKKNQKPHTLCMIFEEIQDCISLKQTHCTCEAGNSESCSHLVALAYLLQHYLDKRYLEVPCSEEVSCTEKPVSWNKPRGPKIEPEPVSKLEFQNPLNERRRKAPTRSTLSPQMKNKKFSLPNNADIMELKNKLQDVSNKIPLTYLLCTNADDKMVEVEEGLFSVPENSLLGYQLHQKQHEHILPISLPCCESELENILLSMPPVTTDQFLDFTYRKSYEIEVSTRKQNSNLLWHELRKCRFTASNFRKIICRRDFTMEFFHSLYKDLSHLPQIRHGSTYEISAIKAYLKKKTHVQYYKCGLIIHPYAPHLGGSPDGIIYDKTCGYGVLEVKCPYSKKYNSLQEACRTKQFCLALDENNHLYLKNTHEYFFQIQGQMLLTGLRWCDFVVYLKCSEELHIQRINVDVEFCREMYTSLTNTYLKLLNLS